MRRTTSNLETAGERLVAIAAGQDVSSSTAASVETVSTELQRYAGLVEQARANNLQGFPVGTAYLRDASDLMQQTILPAADAVYSDAAHDLDQHYRDGDRSRSLQTALLIAAGIALVLLVAAQILVAQRSRRLLNPGLARRDAAGDRARRRVDRPARVAAPVARVVTNWTARNR